MTIEDESVQFLQYQIEECFTGVMDRYRIKDLEWFEFAHHLPNQPNGSYTMEDRAVAWMTDGDDNETNLIVLFPPFISTGANN